MDELFTGAVRTALGLLVACLRAVIWLIWEFCFHLLGWYAGWLPCRLLSLGHYPPETIHEYEAAPALRGFMVCMAGLISLIALATLITRFLTTLN
ncbi:MAG: hypothetical protein V7756_10725 [Halopseudomonas sp.]|uniref:hypothetical protein n=1 Tax=Halopseudomonas sp. TaxID=2901191 RepID=UPI0030011E13